MNIRIEICFKDVEMIDAYLCFEEGKEYLFFADDENLSENIMDLTISDEFKHELNMVNVRMCVYNAIPYDFFTNEGLQFSFDYNDFVSQLKCRNLWGDWCKLREFYKDELLLLDKKIISPEKILNAVNEVCEEESS